MSEEKASLLRLFFYPLLRNPSFESFCSPTQIFLVETKRSQKGELMKKTILLLSTVSILVAGCATDSENKNTKRGAGIGAATGAIAGGILGHQSGKRNEGAILGGAIGGLLGGYAGRRMDQQAQELEKVAETKRTEQGLISKLKSDILFDTGKADLKPQAKTALKEMADIMKKYPENILSVNGYTDNTGSSRINEELSAKRADAVKGVLVADGLPANVISTKGLGPAQPVADNKTPQGRQKNRRVEIEVTVDESKIPQQAQ
jgi:outer membrane protein OmpA-like peptidoglycan-associated protein